LVPVANSFSSSYIAALDGSSEIAGGWIEHNWVQLGYQLAGSTAGFFWSFCLTALILFLMNLIPGLSLRVSPEEEELGLDDAQLGEFSYDYVEITRQVSSLTTDEAHSAHGSTPASEHGEKGAPLTV